MLRDEGWATFYSGLGPSLLSIAPYIAVNFCIYDMWVHFFLDFMIKKPMFAISVSQTKCPSFTSVKKSLPEKYQGRPESSLATALVSASLATLMCYPLDTVRRQMQMKGSPYKNVIDAFPGNMFWLCLIGLMPCTVLIVFLLWSLMCPFSPLVLSSFLWSQRLFSLFLGSIYAKLNLPSYKYLISYCSYLELYYGQDPPYSIYYDTLLGLRSYIPWVRVASASEEIIFHFRKIRCMCRRMYMCVYHVLHSYLTV